jgi:hypothetical protein
MNRKAKDKSGKKKSGRIFDLQFIYKHLTFLCFLILLGIFYIANAHRAEKKVRKINDLKSDINKQRWQYWESMSKVMYEGIQSQTEERVKDLGLKPGEQSVIILTSDDVSGEKEE